MSSNHASHTQPQQKGRLVGHFENRTGKSENNAGWSELWDSDESALWDRGRPSPALIDFLEQRRRQSESESEHLISPSLKDRRSRRPRALVPGCGRGYDVVALALHGFDAYGLEVAPTAVDEARSYIRSELASPREYNFSRPEKSSTQSSPPGRAEIVLGDFFERDWEKSCGVTDVDGDGDTKSEGGFDLIYDYTFLCAIPPNLRPTWARRIRDLLSPSGVLVCLEFPLYKDLDAPGPPYGMSGVYWDLLAERLTSTSTSTSTSPSQKKRPPKSSGSGSDFDRIDYYRPERTYEVGKGTDMMSVWQKKDQKNEKKEM